MPRGPLAASPGESCSICAMSAREAFPDTSSMSELNVDDPILLAKDICGSCGCNYSFFDPDKLGAAGAHLRPVVAGMARRLDVNLLCMGDLADAKRGVTEGYTEAGDGRINRFRDLLVHDQEIDQDVVVPRAAQKHSASYPIVPANKRLQQQQGLNPIAQSYRTPQFPFS